MPDIVRRMYIGVRLDTEYQWASKDPLSLANASVSSGEPDCSLGILKRSIKTTDVTPKRKAAAKRVSRVPAICAVMPQANALRVIAPCDRTMDKRADPTAGRIWDGALSDHPEFRGRESPTRAS